jgi:hypothetical protein
MVNYTLWWLTMSWLIFKVLRSRLPISLCCLIYILLRKFLIKIYILICWVKVRILVCLLLQILLLLIELNIVFDGIKIRFLVLLFADMSWLRSLRENSIFWLHKFNTFTSISSSIYPWKLGLIVLYISINNCRFGQRLIWWRCLWLLSINFLFFCFFLNLLCSVRLVLASVKVRYNGSLLLKRILNFIFITQFGFILETLVKLWKLIILLVRHCLHPDNIRKSGLRLEWFNFWS